MTASAPSVPQVAPLTTEPDCPVQANRLHRASRSHRPRPLPPGPRSNVGDRGRRAGQQMKRDDPSTWVPFTDDEKAGYERPDVGGDPYFSGGGHRMIIRNGAEDLLLDIGARAVWDIAEQMLGKGEVVFPGGRRCSPAAPPGPCFMTQEDLPRAWKSTWAPRREELDGEGLGRDGIPAAAQDWSPLDDRAGHARHVLHPAEQPALEPARLARRPRG